MKGRQGILQPVRRVVSGCYASISENVAASGSGDTIYAHHGTDFEQVVIDTPLLVADGWANTIIDASGAPHGINVDGFDNPGWRSHSRRQRCRRRSNVIGVVWRRTCMSIRVQHSHKEDLYG